MSISFSDISVKDRYGSCFYETMGKEILENLPKVSVKKLGLWEDIYEQNPLWNSVVHPDKIKEPCLFIDPIGRPGIAYKVTLFNNKNEPVAEIAELIFKKWSLNDFGRKGQGLEHNYTVPEFCLIKVLNEQEMLRMGWGDAIKTGKIRSQIYTTPDQTKYDDSIWVCDFRAGLSGLPAGKIANVGKLLKGGKLVCPPTAKCEGYLKIVLPKEVSEQKERITTTT